MKEMTINQKDIKTFGARLLNYSVSGTAFTQNTLQATGICNIPRAWSTSFANRTLTVTLVFKASKLNDNAKNASIFERLSISTEHMSRFETYVLNAGVLTIALPDGFLYSGIINSIGTAEYDGSGEQEVTYTFTVIRHKPLQTVELKGAATELLCESTAKTHCRINITADKDYSSLTVMGITVSNISGGEELIIDGINGLITLNGCNKFSESDLISFPTLQPGTNIINNTASTSQGSISYYPVYI